MKVLFSLVMIAALQITGFAQTKKVAHRSHSGSNHNFSLKSLDNFGETPEMIKAWEEQQLKEQKEKEKKKKKEEQEKILIEKAKQEEPQKASVEVKQGTTPGMSKKDLKKAKKEQKKLKKELKKSKKGKNTSAKGNAPKIETSQTEESSQTPVQTKQVLDNTKQTPQESEASVSWIILLLLIALPSTLAIKAINLKL